jgi:hypothetical protein
MKGEGEELSDSSCSSSSPFAPFALRSSTIAVCPLCSTDFESEGCHASCPMARGCRMTRCPRCGFEFVSEGFIAGLLKKLVGRWPMALGPEGVDK